MFTSKEQIYLKEEVPVFAIQVDLDNSANTAKLHAFVDYESIELSYNVKKITYKDLVMYQGDWLIKDFLGEKFTVISNSKFKKEYYK